MSKTILKAIAMAAIVCAAAIAPSGAFAAKAVKAAKCQMVGGGATMVTEDLAKYMAEAALKNAITAKGLKPTGTAKVTCDKGGGLPNCHARQKACG